MPVIDLHALLQPITADRPCGGELDGSPALYALELAAKEPEHRMFEERPVDERNWRSIREQSIALFQQSKDLRVSVHLARALLHTDGLVGFCVGLALIKLLVEDFWPGLYPPLDVDDDNDPTERFNVLRELAGTSLLNELRVTPLAAARGLGAFSFKDLLLATGEIKPNGKASGVVPPKLELIAAAFDQSDLEELQAKAEAARGAVDNVQALTAAIRQQVGTSPPFDLSELDALLRRIDQTLTERLSKRGGSVDETKGPAAVASGPAVTSSPTASETLQSTPSGNGQTAPATVIMGEIRSREDVVRMLEKVCQYYTLYEPSSPVPVLLDRAKRLVTMSFVEIIRDLADKGLPQIEAIAGKEPKS